MLTHIQQQTDTLTHIHDGDYLTIIKFLSNTSISKYLHIWEKGNFNQIFGLIWRRLYIALYLSRYHRRRVCSTEGDLKSSDQTFRLEYWRHGILQFKAWQTGFPESCLCWSVGQLPGLLSEGAEFVDVDHSDLEVLLTRVNTRERSWTQFGTEWTGRRTGWGSLKIFH